MFLVGWCWEPDYGEVKVWDEEAEEGCGLGGTVDQTLGRNASWPSLGGTGWKSTRAGTEAEREKISDQKRASGAADLRGNDIVCKLVYKNKSHPVPMKCLEPPMIQIATSAQVFLSPVPYSYPANVTA